MAPMGGPSAGGANVAADGSLDADTETRCRDLLRTLPALGPQDGSAPADEEPALDGAEPELWAFSEDAAEGGVGGAVAGDPSERQVRQLMEAPADQVGGALFLSHAWDEPREWSKYFAAQPFTAAKQLQVSTGLRAAVNRKLARPRVWVDCASLYEPVRGGDPHVECDHPLAQVSFGPYQMHIRALKDPAFLPGSEGCSNGYTVLRLLQGHSFEGTMNIRSFDAAGRPDKQVDPRVVQWEIAPGCYYVRSAHVLSEDKISPEVAATKEPFQSRAEHLRSWCARLGLRDEVWVEFTLGSIRTECLALAEPMLAMQDGFVAVVTWNYFDRLWPLCEWAIFCAHRGPDRVQLAVDAFVGPALVEYHRAIRRLSVASAACREPLDRELLLGKLERIFVCEAHLATVGFEKPDPSAPLRRPVQQRQVDFSRVERYVRATAIAVFAREAALTATRRAHADDEAGWAGLSAELRLEELHGALRRCKPFDWAERAAAGPADAEAAYAAAVEGWWARQVLPVLSSERRRALR